MLVLAGVLHLLRLARWQGVATGGEALIWALHLGYAFVPLGALSLGAAALGGVDEIEVASLHVWTVGALGTMTLAVMTRATLAHTGADLHAGLGTVAIYLAMPAALIARLAAPLARDSGHLHWASGLFWVAGFLGFAVLYGPRLVRRRENAEISPR